MKIKEGIFAVRAHAGEADRPFPNATCVYLSPVFWFQALEPLVQRNVRAVCVASGEVLFIWDGLLYLSLRRPLLREARRGVRAGSISVCSNALLHPRLRSHIHTWKLPSKTTVWSAGHSWPLNVWPRNCSHSSPPWFILKPWDPTDTVLAAHVCFYATAILIEYRFYGEQEKWPNSMLRLVDGKKRRVMCFLLKLWPRICEQADYSMRYRRQI